MKKSIFLVLVLLVISCGGSKDLLGTWSWEETSGGITGGVENTETTSEIPALVITKDSIKEYEKGILMGARAYHVETRRSTRTGKYQKMIIYEDGGLPHFFKLQGQELILYEECQDCYQYKYIKN